MSRASYDSFSGFQKTFVAGYNTEKKFFAVLLLLLAVKMDRLPKETFLLITDYLDFEARFQFSYVCKSWHSIISNHNLYETVYIDEEHEAPINFFDQHKPYGNTVKSLQVNCISVKFPVIKEWPNHFPNIQNLSLSIPEVDMFSPDYEEEHNEDELCYEEEGHCFDTTDKSFESWKRLASISEFTRFLYTGSILLSGYYSNLTSMDLNFNIVPYHALDAVMDNLAVAIKNAPNLKYLKLIVAQVTLRKLNILHQNSPNIEALVLEDISLGEDTTTASTEEKYTPATKLLRLEMQGSRHSFYENDTLSIPNWLQFISQKYPSIEILKMNQFTPANIEYEEPIVRTIDHCKNLKAFNVDFCYFSSSVLQAFDSTEIKLEKYSSQSQDLTELRNLSISNQRHSIYRLDLVVPVGNTDLIDVLSQFTGLTTINTYPSSDIDYALGNQLQVPLDSLLKHHKKLEFLSLSSCHIYLKEEEHYFTNLVSSSLDDIHERNRRNKKKQQEIQSVLDTLEMEKVTAKTENVFQFISHACSKLKVLIVTAKFEHHRDWRLAAFYFDHSLVYMKVYIEEHKYIKLKQTLIKGDEWYEVQNEGRKIIYKPMDDACSEMEAKGGVLSIYVTKVDRFVVSLPRNPFLVS